MAYNKAFNPDALPAHAEPEEAAQALSRLQAGRRPSGPGQGQSQGPAQGPAGRGGPPPPNPQYQQYQQHQQQQQQQQQNFRPASAQHLSTAQLQQQFANSRISSPPPPQNYGQGPRPNVGAQNRPPPQIRPPRTPVPPPQTPDESDLYPLFQAANVSRSGTLSERELSSALVNGDYTSFDPYTIKCLLRMFSSTPSKSHISYEEFVNLWRFLAAWRELFERFDEDRSGRINLQEFEKALVQFGYRLSQTFTRELYNSFNNRGNPGRQGAEGMSFDLFVQACVNLKRMTDVFKRYDDDRDGYITLGFEEFLTDILTLRD